MGKTKIEWSEATWNPIKARTLEDSPLRVMLAQDLGIPAGKSGYHCEPVSPGCANCYAERMNIRRLPTWGTGLVYNVPNRAKVEIYLDQEVLEKPLHWKRPRKVFPCSMTDLFADFVTNEMRDAMFTVMAAAPQHTYQLLTKRSKHMWSYFQPGRLCADHPIYHLGENIQLGVSVENQEYADKRIPDLLATPATFRWVSYEPALGPVDWFKVQFPGNMSPCGIVTHRDVLTPWGRALDWGVIGAESGPGARTLSDWIIRDTIRQFRTGGVPLFVKQRCDHQGNKIPFDQWPKELQVREYPQ